MNYMYVTFCRYFMLCFTEKTGIVVGTYRYFSSFVMKQVGVFVYNRDKTK